jgi:hypothetical protein
MEEIESVVKELRIDWDEAICEDYNPLKYAIALDERDSFGSSNFRDMYHKLERAMEKIIEKSYQGFSDSILTYREAFKLNRECMTNIENIIEKCEIINSCVNVDLGALEKEKNDVELIKNTHEILHNLKEIRDSIKTIRNMIDRGEYLLASSVTKNAILKFDGNQFGQIKGVRYLRSELQEKERVLTKMVADELLSYIFEKENEGTAHLRCIFILNSLEFVDNYIFRNSRKMIFLGIQRVIAESDSEMERRGNRIEALVKSVANYIYMILVRFSLLLEKFNKHLRQEGCSNPQNDKNNFFEYNTESGMKVFSEKG